MNTFQSLIAAVFLTCSTTTAFAHEFWISPLQFTIDPGEAIVADLRVGQVFEGSSMSFLPNAFRRFDLAQSGNLAPVEGRMGDRPAMSQAVADDGLAIVIHETTDSVLTWEEFAKFEDFVRHKDAAWTLSAHAARGLPDTGFREGYSRYAKSLVAVGGGEGQDTEFGLETELVARANPYTDDLSQGMPVDLYYKGAPRAAAQIEVFERAPDGSVAVSTVRTNDEGRAVVPVRSAHVYMLDAVVLREPEGALAERPDIVWESLWANLTFEVPG